MPEKARRILPTLRTGDFVRRGDNLVAIGLPGRGKTGYCAALARELIERHQMKVLFVPAFKLAARLLAAKRDLKLLQALAKLNSFDVVIVDELGGYVDMSPGRSRRPLQLLRRTLRKAAQCLCHDQSRLQRVGARSSKTP